MNRPLKNLPKTSKLEIKARDNAGARFRYPDFKKFAKMVDCVSCFEPSPKPKADPLPTADQAVDAPCMQFSTFPNIKQSTAKPFFLDKKAFISIFSRHHIRVEKDGPLFAPAIFREKRSNKTFIAAYGLCLDFDHGNPTIGRVLESLGGLLATYYSTHSHTPDAPRFRVVLPLSRPVDAGEHAQLVLGVKSILPPDVMECLDTSCFERARPHYMPSCPHQHEQHAFTGHQDGEPLNVKQFIALGAAVATFETTRQDDPAAAPLLTFEYTDSNTGKVLNLTTWAAQNPRFDIVTAIDVQHRRGGVYKDGKQHITCPFENQHTSRAKDRATFVVNASPPNHNAWDVHCCHAHCEGRDRLEFLLAMLKKGWISVEQLEGGRAAAIAMKRPPKIYYPVNDILAASEWSSLTADEKQKALHLMTMMWAEDDGMIDDNDWKIARHLGMPERDWKELYRPTLERTGWLIAASGRLTNDIVKREFDLAQIAYTRAITRAAAGGKATQEKARAKLNQAPA